MVLKFDSPWEGGNVVMLPKFWAPEVATGSVCCRVSYFFFFFYMFSVNATF